MKTASEELFSLPFSLGDADGGIFGKPVVASERINKKITRES
jgi:hypothetical protein